MKKHTAFVTAFLKDAGHPELVDLWNSVPVRTEWLKLRFVKENAPKRRKTSYLLFCSDFRPAIVAENPYDSATRIVSRLAEKWRSHKDANDDVYQKYKTLYAKQKFFDLKRGALALKYPHLTDVDLNALIEKIYEKSIDINLK